MRVLAALTVVAEIYAQQPPAKDPPHRQPRRAESPGSRRPSNVRSATLTTSAGSSAPGPSQHRLPRARRRSLRPASNRNLGLPRRRLTGILV